MSDFIMLARDLLELAFWAA